MTYRTLTTEEKIVYVQNRNKEIHTWLKVRQHLKQQVMQHLFLIKLYNQIQDLNHEQVNHRLLNQVSFDHNQQEAKFQNKSIYSHLLLSKENELIFTQYFTSHVVIPRDENLDIVSSTVILPTPITSI